KRSAWLCRKPCACTRLSIAARRAALRRKRPTYSRLRGCPGSVGWGPAASGIFATIVGALIFSAFHYVGAYGDRLEVGSFVFRAIAGVAFSALYIVRGFGITAWTHALYDVMLLVTQG
ncbi:MAG: CPBP family glutamic-type intramembrane protease, partial [Gemmatimonadota bacterium]